MANTLLESNFESGTSNWAVTGTTFAAATSHQSSAGSKVAILSHTTGPDTPASLSQSNRPVVQDVVHHVGFWTKRPAATSDLRLVVKITQVGESTLPLNMEIDATGSLTVIARDLAQTAPGIIDTPLEWTHVAFTFIPLLSGMLTLSFATRSPNSSGSGLIYIDDAWLATTRQTVPIVTPENGPSHLGSAFLRSIVDPLSGTLFREDNIALDTLNNATWRGAELIDDLGTDELREFHEPRTEEEPFPL